jgi:serine/threonine protein kinase
MVEKSSKQRSINDYQLIRSIGEGAFGKVYLAVEKETKLSYAIKTLDKTHILKYNKTKHVYRERDILNRLST